MRAFSVVSAVAVSSMLARPSIAQAAPLQYLSGAGEKATPVVGLTWFLLLVSIAVVVIVGALLAGAIWRRPGQAWRIGEKSALLSHAGGLNWLYIGVGVSTLVLLLSVVWTVQVLAEIGSPPAKPALTIEITGKQWWWQVRYLSADVTRQFTTANEIHIPAGRPVRLRLIGGDVIHSFWVPQLAGKMDAIPGMINETWIEAAHPGVYRGQCTEYCGLEHARMGIVVVAQDDAAFQKWWTHQLAPPQKPHGAALTGQQDFQASCAGCHTVRGSQAAGTLGPDLSHLMTRSTIAAGMLPNNAPTLTRWIADPQSFKPGCMMPTPALNTAELADVSAYLKTLD